jgi:hypothetical protein
MWCCCPAAVAISATRCCCPAAMAVSIVLRMLTTIARE